MTQEEIKALIDRIEAGDDSATCELGERYYYGDGVAQDYTKAAY